MDKNCTCAVIGKVALRGSSDLEKTILNLIENHNVTHFLFHAGGGLQTKVMSLIQKIKVKYKFLTTRVVIDCDFDCFLDDVCKSIYDDVIFIGKSKGCNAFDVTSGVIEFMNKLASFVIL